MTHAALLGRLEKAMSLINLMKGAIASGKLTEPFTPRQVSEALCRPNWPPERVQHFLARHCQGNLAAFSYHFERVGSGQYRLLRETGRDRNRPAGPLPEC